MAAIEVIIPYYQREPGILSRALSSIATQGVSGVRVIIVDDASPHPGRDELAGISPPDGVTYDLIEQANTGAGGARNTGLQQISADAQIVCLLDSDDEWSAGHLERVQRILSLPGVDFMWSAVGEDDQFAESYAAPSKKVDANLIQPIADETEAFEVLNLQKVLVDPWYEHMHLSTIALSARLARKATFKADMRAAEDFDFLCQCSLHAERVASSDYVAVERGTGENVWHGVDPTQAIFTDENFNTMSVLKWFRLADGLDGADQTKIRETLAHVRRNFLWSQGQRVKAGKPPRLGLAARWLARDPGLVSELFAILGEKSGRAAKAL